MRDNHRFGRSNHPQPEPPPSGADNRRYQRARARQKRNQQLKGQSAYRKIMRQQRIAAEDAAAKQRILAENLPKNAAMIENIRRSMTDAEIQQARGAS